MSSHKFTTTREERLKELERELAMRHKVYPEWIRSGKIKRDKADYRIRILTDVVEAIRLQLEAAGGTQQKLF